MSYSRTEVRAPNTTTGAVVTDYGDGVLRVAFGRWDKAREVLMADDLAAAPLDSFCCRAYDCERKYKSQKAADKAIAAWMAS